MSFLIVPLSATCQTLSTTVELELLRKAALLIVEGDECKAILPIKDAQIENKETVIKELYGIRSEQDSIISLRTQQLNLKDSIISNKNEIIESKDKQVKKFKLISLGTVVVLVLSIVI